MAISLDGTTTGYVSVGATGDLDFSGDFTIELFANIDSTTTDDTAIIGKSSDDYAYYIRLQLGLLKFAKANINSYISSSLIRDNTWHWIVFERKGNNAYIWVDGKRAAACSMTTAPAAKPTQPFLIGRLVYGGYNGAKMLFEEVRVSNIARYNNVPYIPVPQEAFSADANTKLLLHCNEGSGNPADSSGLDHDGTLESGASWTTNYTYGTVADNSAALKAYEFRSIGKSYTPSGPTFGFPDTSTLEATDDITGDFDYNEASNYGTTDTTDYQCIIDLSSDACVNEVWCYQFQGDGAGMVSSDDIVVSWSDDNSSWTEAATGDFTRASTPSNYLLRKVTFTGVSHRYWKVVQTYGGTSSWRFFNDIILLGSAPLITGQFLSPNKGFL